jgi:KRAB domain-containing zinc finger protein
MDNASRHHCPLCPYEGSKAAFMEHLVVEHAFAAYPCGQCEHVDHDESQLKQHHNECHKNKCTLCHFVSRSTRGLANHVRNQHTGGNRCHVCNICEVQLSSVRSLREHMVSKHDVGYELNIQCSHDDCDYVCLTKSRLNLHIKIVHLGIRDKVCSECDFKSGYTKDLNYHLYKVHGIGRKPIEHRCPYTNCEYTTKRKYFIEEHVKRRHLDQTLCSYCDFQASGRHELELHLRHEHGRGRDTICGYEGCEYTAINEYRISLHRNEVHLRIKDKECSYCDYRTYRKTHLKNHVLNVHEKSNAGFQCPIENCVKVLASAQNLKLHVQAIHLKVKGKMCPLCDYSATLDKTLQNHINTIHKKEKRFQCPLCDVQAYDKTQALVHIDKVHKGSAAKGREPIALWRVDGSLTYESHVESKEYNCTYEGCHHKAADERGLRVHCSKVHFKIKDKLCPHCDYKTDKQNYLDKHIKNLHDGAELGFVCPVANCEKRLFSQQNVQFHIKAVHDRVKDKKCPKCDFCTSWEKTLKHHVTKIHQCEKLFQCLLCDFQSSKKSHVRTHMKKVHKDKAVKDHEPIPIWIEKD